MAEKFPTEEICSDDFVSIMLMSAMTKMDDDSKSEFTIDKAAQDRFVEVELRIGGHECSMREFLKILEESYDRQTTARALEISEERCDNVLNKLSEFERAVGQLIRDKFPEIPEDRY